MCVDRDLWKIKLFLPNPSVTKCNILEWIFKICLFKNHKVASLLNYFHILEDHFYFLWFKRFLILNSELKSGCITLAIWSYHTGRGLADGGNCSPPPQIFGRLVNPIPIKGADYAHQITTCPSRFLDNAPPLAVNSQGRKWRGAIVPPLFGRIEGAASLLALLLAPQF